MELCVCVCSPSPEQMDEGLAGRQRQYEGWIHSLSTELNHFKASNLELSGRLRELAAPSGQPRDYTRGDQSRVYSEAHNPVTVSLNGFGY